MPVKISEEDFNPSEIFVIYENGKSEAVAPLNYSDGQPLIKASENMARLSPISRICLRPRSMNSLMAGLFLVDAITEFSGRADMELWMPHILGGRQDRMYYKEGADALFTAKSVAREINARHFNRVLTLDCHSEVTTALINGIVEFKPRNIIPITLSSPYNSHVKYDYIMAPDVGAVKRAGMVADILNVPLLMATKSRDATTGKIIAYEIVGDTKEIKADSRILVVDDICDGGATFLLLGREIAKTKAIADLYVSHGIFSKGSGLLFKYYNSIITTDSIPHSEPSSLVIEPGKVVRLPVIRKGLETD